MLAERLPYDDPMSESWLTTVYVCHDSLVNSSLDFCCIWGCSSQENS